MREAIPGRTTILLVEDDDADARLARRAFDHTFPDYNLKWVKSGEDAMSYLEGTGSYANRAKYPFPDLMILDMNLPGASGEDVLSWMKLRGRWGKLWITVLTGTVRVERPKAVLESCGQVAVCRADFIKPITPEMVTMMIKMFKLWQKMTPRIEKKQSPAKAMGGEKQGTRH